MLSGVIKFQHSDILCRCTEFGCGDYVDSGLDGTIIKMYTHRPCKMKGLLSGVIKFQHSDIMC